MLPTVGAIASTSTPVVGPTPLSVATALLPTASRTDPPLVSMLLATVMPVLSSSPVTTVKRKTSPVLPEPER
jgi:hypothetical protein